jgi:hypothetical protein
MYRRLYRAGILQETGTYNVQETTEQAYCRKQALIMYRRLYRAGILQETDTYNVQETLQNRHIAGNRHL